MARVSCVLAALQATYLYLLPVTLLVRIDFVNRFVVFLAVLYPAVGWAGAMYNRPRFTSSEGIQ
jgi:hypothetical protein